METGFDFLLSLQFPNNLDKFSSLTQVQIVAYLKNYRNTLLNYNVRNETLQFAAALNEQNLFK